MENLDSYKEAYNQSFNFYDENQWYLAQYAKYLCAKITDTKASSILSLGIGHSVVSNSIIQLLNTGNIQYDIVEGSPDIINKFNATYHNISMKVYESYFETFTPDKKYDAIEMGFVLEHVDDPLLVLKKFKNFLNDKGTMFIAVPNAKSLHRLIGHHAGLLPDMYKLSKYDLELGHKRYFDLDSITNLATEAGLRVTMQRGLMLKTITGEQMKKLDWQKNIIDALFIVGEHYPEISNCIYLEAVINK
nr:class I SAM-dependent methyltransferase [Bacteroidota bacterium]